MCCSANWKREVVPDHKFDFINVRDYRKTDCLTRLKYIWRYILLLKSIAVYGLDIFTAATMIISQHWTNTISQRCGDNCAVPVQFQIAKWIFVGCIIFSFLLLGYETWKAKQVIASRDISYAFTNLLANDYYSFRNYDTFCLFCHIDSSTKKKDDFAFFIFFTFKGWKRLLLADGPRQSINALILYSFAYSFGFQTSDIPAYWDKQPTTAMLLFSMIATVLIFAGSLILLVVAAILYVPLLCYIQGNLKEYVCHKVDKRISEIIKKKQRQRIARQAALEKKLASGAIKNSKGEVIADAMPQPTLPTLAIDDDELMRGKSDKSRQRPERKESSSELDTGVYPGPPPAFHQSYNEYPTHLDYDQGWHAAGDNYGEEYGSSTNLASHAAPLGVSYPPLPSSQRIHAMAPNPYPYPTNPPSTSRSAYQYHTSTAMPYHEQHPTGRHLMQEQSYLDAGYDSRSSDGGLAYDRDYPGPTQDYSHPPDSAHYNNNALTRVQENHDYYHSRRDPSAGRWDHGR